MSEQLSEAEIQEQLRRTREEITDTLNQLVEQVDPRRALKRSQKQAQATAADLSDQARQKVDDLRAQAQHTVDEAKRGDTRSRAIVAGAAVGILVVGLLGVRSLIK